VKRAKGQDQQGIGGAFGVSLPKEVFSGLLAKNHLSANIPRGSVVWLKSVKTSYWVAGYSQLQAKVSSML
jgi:hypothetical protein